MTRQLFTVLSFTLLEKFFKQVRIFLKIFKYKISTNSSPQMLKQLHIVSQQMKQIIDL